jgi:lipoprotein-anchoring transpeptidase ErfK/SrfK
MPIPLILALFATCLASTAGQAQHGTPFNLRNTTPTIEDAEPGREPGPEGKSVPEVYRRQPVFYRTNEAPGTIIIDTSERFLYLIQGNNTALRYGIGVGRDGFQWNGLLKVTRKAEWPDWTPPAEMIGAAALSAALHGRRPGQSHGRARALSRQHGVPHPRHQRAGDHRPRRVVRLFPAGQRADRRSL